MPAPTGPTIPAHLFNAADKDKLDYEYSADQALTGDGAATLTNRRTLLTTDAAANAITLADGTFTGQRKTVLLGALGASGQVATVTASGIPYVLQRVGDGIELRWSGAAWVREPTTDSTSGYFVSGQATAVGTGTTALGISGSGPAGRPARGPGSITYLEYYAAVAAIATGNSYAQAVIDGTPVAGCVTPAISSGKGPVSLECARGLYPFAAGAVLSGQAVHNAVTSHTGVYFLFTDQR